MRLQLGEAMTGGIMDQHRTRDAVLSGIEGLEGIEWKV